MLTPTHGIRHMSSQTHGCRSILPTSHILLAARFGTVIEYLCSMSARCTRAKGEKQMRKVLAFLGAIAFAVLVSTTAQAASDTNLLEEITAGKATAVPMASAELDSVLARVYRAKLASGCSCKAIRQESV
jgi:hypothetical protein